MKNKVTRWGHSEILCIVDSLMSLTVLSPLVVGYWRGSWQLMDTFLFPNNLRLSMFSSLTIGLTVGLSFCLAQHQLEHLLDYKQHPILHVTVSRLYTVVFSLGCVSHWRGVWMFWDIYTGISWISGAVSSTLGVVLLVLTRGLRNVLAPPFVVITDKPEGYFHVPTLYQFQGSMWLRLLDAMFTVLITGSLVVFVWRGTWIMFDRLLYPNRLASSASGSLVIGIILSLLVFALQPLLSRHLRHFKTGIRKLLVEDLYHFLCFLAAVSMWRGVWTGLNVCLLAEQPIMSNLVTAVAGQLLLPLLYCGNSILVRGALKDGSIEGKNCVLFSTRYIRYLYSMKRPSLINTPTLSSSQGQRSVHNKCNTENKQESIFQKLNGGACKPVKFIPESTEIICDQLQKITFTPEPVIKFQDEERTAPEVILQHNLNSESISNLGDLDENKAVIVNTELDVEGTEAKSFSGTLSPATNTDLTLSQSYDISVDKNIVNVQQ